MAVSKEESFIDLLKGFIVDQWDLQDAAGNLDSVGLTIRTLLTLSDSERDYLMKEIFPTASIPVQYGVQGEIRIRKENTEHVADVSAEGEPISKKVKLSRDDSEECLRSAQERDNMEARSSARKLYFEKLLEPPTDLPLTPVELTEFLDQKPTILPLLSLRHLSSVNDDDMLTLRVPEEAKTLAGIVETLLSLMERSEATNEATSSSFLHILTGQFIRLLNEEAPRSRRLRRLSVILESGSQPVDQLAKPHMQLFVRGCLLLRWENKGRFTSTIDTVSLAQAARENTEKLKVWSPLFYGSLPYVIGGCCAGNQFRWLMLAPEGKKVVSHFISRTYDLKSLRDEADFLHSNVRMHCLLQKLQEKLDNDAIWMNLILYHPIEKEDGGTVTLYPHVVKRELRDVDETNHAAIDALYKSIRGSKYLIQGKVTRFKTTTVLVLEPVGDPNSRPVTLKELEDATHDILCGLQDLHKAGYSHKSLRWDNCIKVNVKGIWKWILIDLEAAVDVEAGGVDDVEWSSSEFVEIWDNSVSKRTGRKKKYSDISDLYSLGNLICNWLFDGKVYLDEKVCEVMKSLGEQMMQEELPIREVIKKFCKRHCERCQTFGR